MILLVEDDLNYSRYEKSVNSSIERLRILFLEDDPLDLELSIAKLEAHGIQLDWEQVQTRQDFLACLDDPHYDLILADYNLPSFDGLSALKLLLERKLDIPFIFVSGTLGDENAIESLKSGATDYVLKDRLSRLVPAVERALQEQVERRQHKQAEERIQRLLKQQIAANQLSLSLGEWHKLDDIYLIIYAHVKELMDADAFAISRYDANEEKIYASFIISEGNILDASLLPAIPLSEPGKGTQSQVIRTGEPFYTSDFRKAVETTQKEYTFSPDGEVKEGPPPEEEDSAKSILYVPMKDRGRVVGVMQVQSYRLNAYSQDDIDLLSALANVASLALENARLLEDIRLRLDQLQSIHRIDQAISGSLDLSTILSVLLNEVITQLKVDAADVLLLNPENQTLEFVAGHGFRTGALQHTHLRLGQGNAGRAAMERRMIAITDLNQLAVEFEHSPEFNAENFAVYFGVPLLAKNQLVGVLEIFNRTPMLPTPDWLEFLNSLAGQAAIAIDNATMFNALQISNMEVSLAYEKTLEGWGRALEFRDMETKGHSKRVVDLTLRIASMMGIGETELVDIRRGALLHDIGKMGIPDSILQKPGPLSDDEWVIMRQHPTYAYEMLMPVDHLLPALDIPYCHHEKWDGAGYPRGLKGEDIPLAARIFAVADVFDALTSDRPYRKAWTRQETIQHIREQAGSHFDPQVVAVFLDLID